MRNRHGAICRHAAAWDDADLLLARQLPTRGPLPPWYLWPLLATVYDLEGDGGARARQETDDPALSVACAVDGLCHLAAAVASGRGGDRSAAGARVDATDRCFAHRFKQRVASSSPAGGADGSVLDEELEAAHPAYGLDDEAELAGPDGCDLAVRIAVGRRVLMDEVEVLVVDEQIEVG